MIINTAEISRLKSLSTVKIAGLDLSATWLRGKNGLIAFGKFASTELIGGEPFKSAQSWWQKQLLNLQIQNSLSDPGTGPILFASFGFKSESNSSLIFPEVVIGQNEKRAWITWLGENQMPLIGNLDTNLESRLSESIVKWSPGSLSESDWQQQIATAIELIAKGEIDKVVIARDLIANLSQPISPIKIAKLIQNLEQEYPNTWIFLNNGLV